MTNNTMPPPAFASNQEKDRWVNWWSHQGWALHDIQTKLQDRLPVTPHERLFLIFSKKLRDRLAEHIETKIELRKESIKLKRHLCSHPQRHRELWDREDWDGARH